MSVLFEDLYPPSAKAMQGAPTMMPSIRASGSSSGNAAGTAAGSFTAEGFPAMWAVAFIITALVIIHMSE
jgi:hypothetical protein